MQCNMLTADFSRKPGAWSGLPKAQEDWNDSLLSAAKHETLLEDLNDLAALAERCQDPVVDHATVVARLKADGLL